jgi:hypothetical protein
VDEYTRREVHSGGQANCVLRKTFRTSFGALWWKALLRRTNVG